MSKVLQGPWPTSTLLPPSWFATVNDGASAFSVLASDRDQALTAAIDRIWAELSAHIDPACPFTMDAAETELRVLLGKLRIYSPQEWTEHVLAEAQAVITARWPNWTPQGAA